MVIIPGSKAVSCAAHELLGWHNISAKMDAMVKYIDFII